MPFPDWFPLPNLPGDPVVWVQTPAGYGAMPAGITPLERIGLRDSYGASVRIKEKL